MPLTVTEKTFIQQNRTICPEMIMIATQIIFMKLCNETKWRMIQYSGCAVGVTY